MAALSNHLMPFDRRAVQGDPFGSVADFNIVPMVPDPDLFAGTE
jgi:hypothetical protein